jgi:enoyl-CoA hydratase/carnithine racemase
MNRLDACPLTTIAAVHGVTFGGGFELALACDLIIADKTARFCFPELRLGLIPGFGGIPRLKRDLGNAVVRDLLLTGRSINATKAQNVGLGEPAGRRRRSAAHGSRHRRANRQIRSPDLGHRQAVHQANSTGRTSPRNRNLLRALHSPRGRSWPAQIRGKLRRPAVPSFVLAKRHPS